MPNQIQPNQLRQLADSIQPKEVAKKPVTGNPLLALSPNRENLLDVIAPQQIEIDFDFVKIGNVFLRTIYIGGYPRFVAPGWLEPLINFDHSLDIAFYTYPVEGKSVLDDLRRKIAEMEAEISTDIQRGKVVNPSTQAKLEDARSLQEQLVKGVERFYEFSFYITIPAATLEELNEVTKQVISTTGSLLLVASKATLDQESGFLSTAPFGMDKLAVTRNMDTTSLATTFPFTSAELSSDTGILYGMNSQNESFIIFDRFSLENANCTIFATSGAGKSISYDDEVVYQKSDGEVSKEKIGKVVENIFSNKTPIQLEKGVEGIINPGIGVLAFDKNLKIGWSKVKVAARKVSPSLLYRIKTKSGRYVTITKDHCLVTLKNGVVCTTRGNQAKVGQYLPLPRSLTFESETPPSINTFEVLKKARFRFLRRNLKGRVGNQWIKKANTLPKNIVLDIDFYIFLGLLVAEGMVSYNRVLITSTTPVVLDIARSYLNSLDIRHNNIIKNRKQFGVNVYSGVFAKFLNALGIAGKAGDKSVPGIVFSSSNENVASFLRGYFEGDGGVESLRTISATTKSKKLASDLAYLLYRFGIVARISAKKKAAINTKQKVKRVYYTISISGQENLQNFVTNIGFLSKEKQAKAVATQKHGNTNIDVVPELQTIFEEIYKELYSSSETPAPKKFSGIKLGSFNPSRENLLGITNEIEKRIREVELLEADGLSTLGKLPTVDEIINRGKEKEVNTKLWKALEQSWRVMRTEKRPFLQNVLKAINITHNYQYQTSDIGGAMYRSFKKTGESLRHFDKSLWEAIVIRNGNASYERFLNARDYITKRFNEKKRGLYLIKEKLAWLKTLATSDLFWDPITEVKKIKAKHNYVYDLEVENAVFLAGYAGLFVHNSFLTKIEAVRSLMLGTEIMIIDPENEYKALCDAVGGQYLTFSFNSPSRINPFDLSQIYEEGENQLGLKILSLHSLFKVIMGTLNATQEAMLDRAIVAAYRAKGITQDPTTQKFEPPLMEDLYKALIGMETPEALDLAARIEKFVKGSFVGIFDQQTTIDIKNPFTVFSVRDLQDALRPIAMFVILDFIWTKIKTDIKKRLLIVDEAWHMMKYPDSAQFLWSVVKRARKYYLGLTTITQDVEDFLSQDIGKAIVTNSAMRVLLKQSPAAIDKIGETFYLSQGEKQLLLAADIGEGIFFAGPHHAPIRVVASPEEYALITTNPRDIQQQTQSQTSVVPPEVSATSPAETVGMANVAITGTTKI